MKNHQKTLRVFFIILPIILLLLVAVFFIPQFFPQCNSIVASTDWVSLDQIKKNHLLDIDTKTIPAVKDPSSLLFSLMDKNYSKNSDGAYFSGIKIEGACPRLFQVVSWNGDYAKDGQNIFYRSRKIPDTDIDSFQVMEKSYSFSSYGKDKNAIYINGFKQSQFDPSSFTLVANSLYRKDKKGVYFEITTPETLTQDKSGSYSISPAYKDQPPTFIALEDADPASFTAFKEQDDLFLSNRFAKDRNSVYFQGVKIKDADPETFQILPKSRYAKDKNSLYFYDFPSKSSASLTSQNVVVKVEQVDVNSFQILVDPYNFTSHVGKDGKNVFISDQKLLGADAASFIRLNTYYFKDKNHVYIDFLGFRTLEAADPRSFHIIDEKGNPLANSNCAADKNHTYFDGDKDSQGLFHCQR